MKLTSMGIDQTNHPKHVMTQHPFIQLAMLWFNGAVLVQDFRWVTFTSPISWHYLTQNVIIHVLQLAGRWQVCRGH